MEGEERFMTPPGAVSAAHAAIDRLIDYAGLFPPAQLDMASAVHEYVASRRGGNAWMLGRFIVPASRLSELLAAIPTDAAPLALSVIVDAKPDPRAWLSLAQASLATIAAVRANEPRVRVEALEVPLPPLLSLRESYDATIGQFGALLSAADLRDLPVYVEIPRDERWSAVLPGTMAALARTRFGAKVRCGGVVAEAFPSPVELAAFVRASVSEGVPFKATAGLHHPIRARNEATGFVMHGFLNLLAAATFATKLDVESLAALLADEDRTSIVLDQHGMRWHEESASAIDLAAMRERAFLSYGSCSFSEPIADLTALGILSNAE